MQLIRYFVVERGVFQSQLTLISGIICLALGAFLILRSDIVVSILPIVFGLFVIFDSISRVQNALDLRRCGYDSWKGFLALPVLSVVLGVVVLKERLNRMQWTSVGIATIGVLWLTFSYGRFPWIALVLACSFGTYGLVRKLLGVPPVRGLGVESLWLLLPALACMLLALEEVGIEEGLRERLLQNFFNTADFMRNRNA